jgi:hypothetical protein
VRARDRSTPKRKKQGRLSECFLIFKGMAPIITSGYRFDFCTFADWWGIIGAGKSWWGGECRSIYTNKE